MEVISVSERANQIDIPEYPPLSNDGLDNMEHVLRYGLALHLLSGIKNGERPLPIHVHPSTILSLIQEVRRNRNG